MILIVVIMILPSISESFNIYEDVLDIFLSSFSLSAGILAIALFVVNTFCIEETCFCLRYIAH